MAPKTHKRPAAPDDKGGRTSKRTRFETNPASSSRPRASAPDSIVDEEAFDEQVLADLETAGSSRKNGVKNEGYDSDSSDDGEGVVLSRKSGANEVADEDDDMFASGPSENTPAASAKAKQEKFLSLGDIEGQEFGRGNDGDDNGDALDDEEYEDEDAAERKQKEGMGFEISSFNMKAEMDEGKFAEDGTFHRSFDPHGVHDKWMDGIDDREMRKARQVKKKMEEREREKVQREEDAAKSKDEVSKELVCLLHKGETVLEALQRLGKEAKKTTPARTRKVKGEAANAIPSISSAMDVDEPTSTPSEPSPIERVTALASTLMSLGNIDVYDETYESLLRTVRRSGIVPADWAPPTPIDPADVKYEYKWSPSFLASAGAGNADPNQVFGPFGKDELMAWRAAAYFGNDGGRIELRQVGGLSHWSGWDVIT